MQAIDEAIDDRSASAAERCRPTRASGWRRGVQRARGPRADRPAVGRPHGARDLRQWPQGGVRRAQRPVEAAPEVFRDEAHLLALLGRLVSRPASGVAEFTLRDGASGAVIFPPAAPTGPVLTLRRGEPGTATLERLVRAACSIGRSPICCASRRAAGLNMLVSGPAGSGKTALLAAIARDLDGVARVVTVARHRQFRWPAPSKVELVASPASPYPVLLAAGARLQPSLLVLDSVRLEDVAALVRAAAARRARHPGGTRARGDGGGAGAVGRSRRAPRSRRGRAVPRAVSLEDAAGAAGFRPRGRQAFARYGALPPSPRRCRREATARR